MRLYGETIALVLAASAMAWVHRAPQEPVERARYLCRPVATVGSALALLARQAQQSGTGLPVPEFGSGWRDQCVLLLEEISVHEESN